MGTSSQLFINERGQIQQILVDPIIVNRRELGTSSQLFIK